MDFVVEVLCLCWPLDQAFIKLARAEAVLPRTQRAHHTTQHPDRHSNSQQLFESYKWILDTETTALGRGEAAANI